MQVLQVGLIVHENLKKRWLTISNWEVNFLKLKVKLVWTARQNTMFYEGKASKLEYLWANQIRLIVWQLDVLNDRELRGNAGNTYIDIFTWSQ